VCRKGWADPAYSAKSMLFGQDPINNIAIGQVRRSNCSTTLANSQRDESWRFLSSPESVRVPCWVTGCFATVFYTHQCQITSPPFSLSASESNSAPRTQLPNLTQTKATRLLPFPVCSSETWPAGSLTGSRECGAAADPDKSRRGHPEEPPLMASADCHQHHDSQRGEPRARARAAVTISICLFPGPLRNEVSCHGHSHSAWTGKQVAQRGPVEVGTCSLRYIRTPLAVRRVARAPPRVAVQTPAGPLV
jgi:hypothetical protein